MFICQLFQAGLLKSSESINTTTYRLVG